MNSTDWMEEPIEPKLVERLESLRDVQPREQAAAQHGKALFLAQAKSVKTVVSAAQDWRHKGWISLLFRKEPYRMTTLATIMLVLTLVFGGAGATAYASQESNPDQALYPVKLLSEDLRNELAMRTSTRLSLALEFANRRTQEASVMLQAGKVPPEAVLARWQQEIENAFRIAANLGDPQMNQALEQIQASLQEQERVLAQVRASGDGEPVLLRLRTMLQTRLNWVDNGLNDPNAFRNQVRNGSPENQPSNAPGAGGGNPWTDTTPTPGSGHGPGPGSGDCLNCTPAGSGAQNPWTTGTPTPGSGYGPGPGSGDCLNCTPAGSGAQNPWTTGTPTPGSGYGSGNGGNPYAEGTPTPGSGYGPGPGPDATCTPGSGPGPGPQATQEQGSGGQANPTQGSGMGPGTGNTK
jgi:hypothetical protein